MFHNVCSASQFLQLTNSAGMPVPSVLQTGRQGDRIMTLGWNLKVMIGQKGDRPNVNFRIVVLEIPKGFTISYGNIFDVATNNVLLDDPNKEMCKVKYDRVIRPNQAGLATTGNDEYAFVNRMWIPWKRTVKFGPGDAGTQTHYQPDVYFGIMCYDAFGALISDNVAYFQCNTEMLYKDP